MWCSDKKYITRGKACAISLGNICKCCKQRKWYSTISLQSFRLTRNLKHVLSHGPSRSVLHSLVLQKFDFDRLAFPNVPSNHCQRRIAGNSSHWCVFWRWYSLRFWCSILSWLRKFHAVLMDWYEQGRKVILLPPQWACDELFKQMYFSIFFGCGRLELMVGYVR